MERCNLVDTLARLKDGIHTSVGERGARLSGGERQKVRRNRPPGCMDVYVQYDARVEPPIEPFTGVTSMRPYEVPFNKPL